MNRGGKMWKRQDTRAARPTKSTDLRAGAASGWDYSSRWLRDITRLASIRTTQFIPIDLNAFCSNWKTPSPIFPA
jgi:neutral trehalase